MPFVPRHGVLGSEVAGELLADDNFALEMVRANPLALRMLPDWGNLGLDELAVA